MYLPEIRSSGVLSDSGKLPPFLVRDFPVTILMKPG